MIDELIHEIENADKVLIGIGEDFLEKVEIDNDLSKSLLQKGYASLSYLKEHKDAKICAAYQSLYHLIQEKDYFIVTTCNDDRIYEHDFQKEKIVAPCGNFRYLQCEENCQGELLPVTEEMIQKKMDLVCPHCGKNVCFNQIGAINYNEGGYLEDWEKYQKWLQNTINRKLVVLELGVSLKYPTVIRWPFEKIVFYNNKAKLYRINETLSQLPEQIKEKGISIAQNPLEFLF